MLFFDAYCFGKSITNGGFKMIYREVDTGTKNTDAQWQDQSLLLTEEFLWQSVSANNSNEALTRQDYFYFDALFLGQCETSYRAGNPISWRQNRTALQMLIDALMQLCQILGLNPYASAMVNLIGQMRYGRDEKELYSLLTDMMDNANDTDPENNMEQHTIRDIIDWLRAEEQNGQEQEKWQNTPLIQEWLK